jgi:two-component system, LytTR family, sensor kinase
VSNSLWVSGPILLPSGREISKATLFHALNLAGWISLASGFFAWALTTDGFLPALLNNIVFAGSGVGTSLAMRAIYRCSRTSRHSYLIVPTAILLSGVIGAPLWYAVHMGILRVLFPFLGTVPGLHDAFAPVAVRVAVMPWLIPIGIWFVYGFALITWSALYFWINSALALEIERTRVVNALKLADSARLRALQSQLKPHFLFNTLNGIATLIRERNHVAAGTMVAALSDFLRLTLQTLDSPEIPVAQELVFVERYLQIEQARFGKRLVTTIDAQPEALEAMIPTLMLQPLLENAVRHAVLEREEGGRLLVAIRRNEAQLVVSVQDDGPGLRTQSQRQFGMGLGNTAERLAALYGPEGKLSIGPSDSGGFAVSVAIPFRTAPLAPDVGSILAETL